MSQTPRLLLIAPSAMERTPAFERAAALAQAMQLPLHIVAFDYLQALAVAGLFAPEQIRLARDGYLRTHRQWLAEQASLLARHQIMVTSEVMWVQDPFAEILQFINEMPLRLIIKDVQHESVLERIFYTPLDWQLLRDCPVPVHLVTDDTLRAHAVCWPSSISCAAKSRTACSTIRSSMPPPNSPRSAMPVLMWCMFTTGRRFTPRTWGSAHCRWPPGFMKRWALRSMRHLRPWPSATACRPHAGTSSRAHRCAVSAGSPSTSRLTSLSWAQCSTTA